MTNYMSIVLTSRFPQGKLLNPIDFIEYVKERDLYITIKELEFYDKNGILRPVVRMNRKFKAIDLYGFAYRTKEGQSELPKERDFKPWINYNTEKIELYYHPFQIIILDFLYQSKISQIDLIFNSNIKSLKLIKKNIISNLIKLKTTITESINFRVEFLMLINDAYGPLIKGFQINTTNRMNYYNEWFKWRKNDFNPRNILNQSKLSVKEIDNYYRYLSLYVRQIDPLNNWYELLSIIRQSKKNRLKFNGSICRTYNDKYL